MRGMNPNWLNASLILSIELFRLDAGGSLFELFALLLDSRHRRRMLLFFNARTGSKLLRASAIALTRRDR
jgi:hypothetical protein